MKTWNIVISFLVVLLPLSAKEDVFTVEGLVTGVHNASPSGFGFKGTIIRLVEARGMPESATERLLITLKRAGYAHPRPLKDDEVIVVIPETEASNIRFGWCVRISGYTQPNIRDGKIVEAGGFKLIQHANRPQPLYSRKGYSIVEYDQKVPGTIDSEYPVGERILSIPRLIELSNAFLKTGFGDGFELPFYSFALRSDLDLYGEPFWRANVMYRIPENLRDSIGSDVMTVKLAASGEILMRIVKDEVATIPKFEEVEQAAPEQPLPAAQSR